MYFYERDMNVIVPFAVCGVIRNLPRLEASPSLGHQIFLLQLDEVLLRDEVFGVPATPCTAALPEFIPK